MTTYCQAKTLVISFFWLALQGSRGIQISELRVPETVRNGSDEVILDCVYTLKPEEVKFLAKIGLVIKWFFNNSPAPVYQWIPGQRPQELGILKGRLDLQYEASKQTAFMYRALRIVKPTTDLSGEYKCTVSTFHMEDFMIKKMIVFAPEKKLELLHEKTEGFITVLCRAFHAYPQPRLAIYKISNRETKVALPEVQFQIVSWKGAFDITATADLQETYLDSDSSIECEISLPETNYSNRQRMFYYPGSQASLSSKSIQSLMCRSTTYIIILLAGFVTT